jgi:CPA1 family monovalent cation:H+ antiporter
VWYGVAVSLAVIVLRFLWIFPLTLLPGRLFARIRGSGRFRDWRLPFVIAFTGMRGGVSLAAALALPLMLDDGTRLPLRDLVIFLTYAVILATLVVQGLTLPLLIRRLGLHESPEVEEQEEALARYRAVAAALERLDQLAPEDWTNEDTIGRVRAQYEFRQRRVKIKVGKIEDEEGIEDRSRAYQRLLHELFTAERGALVGLRDSGEISGEVMRRVERELDLEESRLDA